MQVLVMIFGTWQLKVNVWHVDLGGGGAPSTPTNLSPQERSYHCRPRPPIQNYLPGPQNLSTSTFSSAD